MSAAAGKMPADDVPIDLNTVADIAVACRELMVYTCGGEIPDIGAAVMKLLTEFKSPTMSETYGYEELGLAALCESPDFVEMLDNFFQKVRADLAIKIDVVERERNATDRVVEVLRSISVADALADCLDSDIHTQVIDCKANKPGTATECVNNLAYHDASAETHRVVCTYHQYDSLCTHLVLAAICALKWAKLTVGMTDERQLYLTFVTALVHDLAKPTCTRAHEYPKRAFISYHAHGEIGGDVLRALLCPKAFDESERALISLLVTQHMCGYHGPNDDVAQQKRGLLRHIQLYTESIGTDPLPFLEALAFGDGVGKLAGPQHLADDKASVMLQNMADFRVEMAKPFDFPAYLRRVKLPSHTMVLMPIAASGAGKSWWTQRMTEQLDAAGIGFIVLARDAAIAHCTVAKGERLTGNEYALMYEIYEICKAYHSRAIKSNQKMRSRLGADYAAAVDAWNDVNDDHKIRRRSTPPDLANAVKAHYNEQIVRALDDPAVKVVIIDSFITSFPKGVRYGLTQRLQGFFKIHVRINNLNPIVGQNGLSDDDQLQLSGPYSVRQPGHPDGLRDLKEFTSSAYSTGSYTLGTVRPDLVLGCARIPGTTYGYDDTWRIVTELAKRLADPHPARAATSGKVEVDVATGSASAAALAVPPSGWSDFAYRDYDIRDMCQAAIDAMGMERFVDSMGQVGFKVNHPLASASPTDLAKLCKLWADATICDPYTAAQIEADPTLYNSLSQSLFLVKYIDALHGPRFWQNKWARQARGTALFRNPMSGKVSVLSYKLQRGAEVLTGKQKKGGIESTENWTGDNSIFDDDQIKVIDALMNEKALRTYATSKGDGSLCVFTLFMGQSKAVMDGVIEVFGSKLAHKMAEQSTAVSNNSCLVVMSTQGTIFDRTEPGRPPNMEPYMVTACLTGSNLVPLDELADYAKKNTYVEAWDRYGKTFIEQLIGARLPGNSEAQSFMFEAICPNRRDVWLNREHTELAVAYDVAMLYFLGASLAAELQYIPHMLVRDVQSSHHITWPSIFREPLWWAIDDAEGVSTVDALLTGFSNVILGKMTKFELLQRFVPSNSGIDYADPDVVSAIPLDVEGLVLMTPMSSTICGVPQTDYAKAKTDVYYRTHKFRSANVKLYLELGAIPYAKTRFPLVGRVCDFFQPGKVTDALLAICNSAMGFLDGSTALPDEDDEAAAASAASASAVSAASAKTYRAKYMDQFPAKACHGFDRRPANVQMCMLVNLANDFGTDLVPIACEQFPSMSMPDDTDNTGHTDHTGHTDPMAEVGAVLKGLIMALRPWIALDDDFDDLSERIAKLGHDSDVMRKLAGLVLGFKM